MALRRSRGDGSLYWNEKRQRWIAQVVVGFRSDGRARYVRRYRRTKTDARKALTELKRTVDDGLPVEDPSYNVEDAVSAWLSHGLGGKAAGTRAKNESWAKNHVIPDLGRRKLCELTAEDVDKWLEVKAKTLSTDTVRQVYSVLRRSIRHAQARDRVRRNVADLCLVPKGQDGRPSKSLSLAQAESLLNEAEADDSVVGDYIIVSLATGARTDEIRGLEWSWVELPGSGTNSDCVPTIHVWGADRESGDTKTAWSRRSLEVPNVAVCALRRQRERQEAMRDTAGCRWTATQLVFTTRYGTSLEAGNVRRAFRRILRQAGVEAPHSWTPRELRQSFVSLLSNYGRVDLEAISRVVGHANTGVTQKVYRKELRPRLVEGASAVNTLFERGASDS